MRVEENGDACWEKERHGKVLDDSTEKGPDKKKEAEVRVNLGPILSKT